MEKREDRRDRSYRYAERARAVWHHFVCRNSVGRRHGCSCKSVGCYTKRKSLGCGCKRRRRGCSPKIAGGFCHGAGYTYHPCVIERIDGKRLTRAWLRELRVVAPDDVDL